MSASEEVERAILASYENGVLHERAQIALSILLEDGPTDGAHHKMWVIDQAVRALTGDAYESVITAYEQGDPNDDDDYYEWDTGIAP